MLKARCKKCGLYGKIDNEGLSIEETKEKLSKISFGECPFGGYHVEIGNITDYIEILEEVQQ